MNVTTYRDLYREVVTRLFDMFPDRLMGTSLGDAFKLIRNKDSVGRPLQVSDGIFVEASVNPDEVFRILIFVLERLEIEDELTVKCRRLNSRIENSVCIIQFEVLIE